MNHHALEAQHYDPTDGATALTLLRRALSRHQAHRTAQARRGATVRRPLAYKGSRRAS